LQRCKGDALTTVKQFGEVWIGMEIKSLVDNRIGTVVEIDYNDDAYAKVQWEGEEAPSSGFYGTSCECEVVGVDWQVGCPSKGHVVIK